MPIEGEGEDGGGADLRHAIELADRASRWERRLLPLLHQILDGSITLWKLNRIHSHVALGTADSQACTARPRRHCEDRIAAVARLALGVRPPALDAPHLDLRRHRAGEHPGRLSRPCKANGVDRPFCQKGGDGLARGARVDDGLLVDQARAEEAVGERGRGVRG